MCKFKRFGEGPFLSFRGGRGPELPRHGTGKVGPNFAYYVPRTT